MILEEYVQKYCLTPAISGHEDLMIKALHDDLKAFVDEISVDNLGNVIALIKGKSETAPKLMIFAHTDQIGMFVKAITDEGFLKIVRLGGVPERILAGATIQIKTKSNKAISGVIGTISHHLTPDDKKYVVPKIEDMYVDIGASNKAEALALGVEVGSPAFYEPKFTKLANNRIAATSIDDRAGCAVLVKVAERLSANKPEANVYIVGSVQEEFNLRGALVAAQQIKPDAAISLDLAVATDTPDMKGVNELALDKGPIIGLYTFHGRGTLNGLIPHPKMVKIVEDSATKLKMNLQRHASVGMLTDGSYVQFVEDGVPCVDLAWPTRYTHTGVETCSLNDLQNLEDLTFNIVKNFPINFSGSRI
jgi:putative aminopeptidase FrvX